MRDMSHISDHEIPLAIGVLKGISWVSSYYNSGLLLFINMTHIQISGVRFVARKLMPMIHYSGQLTVQFIHKANTRK
jgi:hypothetical protein